MRSASWRCSCWKDRREWKDLRRSRGQPAGLQRAHESRYREQLWVMGYVTSKNESSKDVGEEYYDTEGRFKTRRTKQERLLTLLEKAETMEDILSLETTPLGQRMTVGFQASLRKFSQSLQNFLI